MRGIRVLGAALLLALLTLWAAPSQAQPAAESIERMLGRRVASVRIERLGQAVADARLEGLIETKAGAPLSMREVRDSLLHLYNTGLFEAVNVSAEAAGGAGASAGEAAVTVVYHLTPARTVTRYD